MLTKKCKDCEQVLPSSEFSEYKSEGRKWLASYCKQCVRLRTRKSDLKKRYGLSVEDFEDMLEKQGNKCGICDQVLEGGRRTHIDHCHASGKIRKLLCPNCNTGIGKFKDDLGLLKKAIKYLEEN